MLLSPKEMIELTAQLNVYAETRNGDPLKLLKIGNHIFDVPEFIYENETISAHLVSFTGTTKVRVLTDGELGQVCMQVLAHSRLVYEES